MAGWFSELSQRERRTLNACFGGWGLNVFDFNLYALALPTLLVVFNFSRGEAGVLATVTLVTSAVGGWVTGMLSDRFGRVRVLLATILWFAVFAFLTGFANNFGQFFTFGALQGLGFGGEWAAGAVLMGEVIRAQYRGRAVGTVQSAWAVGWGGAVLAQAILFSILPLEWAWRALFWLGILPVFLLIYIRRFVDEPTIFRAQHRTDGAGMWGQMVAIFAPQYLRVTLITVLLTTGVQGGYHAIALWLPTFLRLERGLSVLSSSGYLAFVIFGAFCGIIAGAHFADWFGRKATFLLFAVGSIFIVALYTFVPVSNVMLAPLGFPLGFFAHGMFAPLGPFLTELYPTAIRATGQGFAFNAGRAVGAIFPALVGFLNARLGGLGHAIGIFALCAYGLIFIALVLLPETRGRELPSGAT